MIEAKIRCAGLCNIIGTAGQTNVQGETQQKLDVYANEALLHCLGVRDSVAPPDPGEVDSVSAVIPAANQRLYGGAQPPMDDAAIAYPVIAGILVNR
jgi:fructose-1,6-bisphosphatase